MSRKKSKSPSLIFVFLLALSEQAFAWNPFGPKTLEDCLIKEMPKAQTPEAAKSIEMGCIMKFSRGDSESNAALTRLNNRLKKCGVDNVYEWMAPTSSQATSSVINKLINISLRNSPFDGRISFQNNNSVAIDSVLVGFTKEKSCPRELDKYSAVTKCTSGYPSSPVRQFTYGSLVCHNLDTIPNNLRGGFCIASFSPFGLNTNKEEIVEFLEKNNFCQR